MNSEIGSGRRSFAARLAELREAILLSVTGDDYNAASDAICDLLFDNTEAILALVEAAEALYSNDAPRSYNEEFSRRSAALLTALEALNA